MSTPITATSQGSATTAPQKPQTAEGDSAANLASDFDTFLKLLTTQLKNQDPSKPFDSTEFVGQLASFSAVEQQIATNSKLDELVAALNGNAASGLAEWVGRGVLSDAPTSFDGGAIPVNYILPKDTSSASILIYDDAGTLVDRMSVLPGSTQTTWDGLAMDGSQMPSGSYRFAVETYEGTTLTGTHPAQTFSTVVEARIENGEPQVVFADGSMQMVEDITAVRRGS